jgi:hypothetical protein
METCDGKRLADLRSLARACPHRVDYLNPRGDVRSIGRNHDRLPQLDHQYPLPTIGRSIDDDTPLGKIQTALLGSIAPVLTLTNHIIDQQQYTILVTAVIGSAVVPTVIAQRWFQPAFKPIKDQGKSAAASGKEE